VVMCTFIFYFAYRIHSMFKSDFESKEFENLKKSCKKKMFFYIDLSSGPNSFTRVAQLRPMPPT
jgi:hypothetical protein